jgi:hypothetical protein
MAQRWPHGCRWGGVVLVALVCLTASTLAVAEREDAKRGRPLAEILRALHGLRIVFSSEIVTPDMRVLMEPRGRGAREVLDEILKPHGLMAEDGPGGVIQIVRAPRGRTAPARSRDRRASADTPPATRPVFAERVLVNAPATGPRDTGVPSEFVIGTGELQHLAHVPADDPQRVIHALPGVAAEHDFRSELSVRGSPYRHIGVFVDGIPAPWLQHAIAGRGDVGSVAMISADVLSDATLQAGAYPQRHGTRLGAQLALTLREGSRTATRVSGTLGGTNAALVSEGPVGRRARGSWLAAVRQSYRDWPISRCTSDGTVLGYTDLQTKVVYDVSPGQQISVTALAGRMGADGPDEAVREALARATSHVAVLTAAWRSTLSERFVVTQQVYGTMRQYRNSNAAGATTASGATGDLSYRADAIRAAFGGLVEFGGQFQQSRGLRSMPVADRFDGRASFRSGYMNYSWQTRRATITPGVRFTHSSLRDAPVLSRWVLAEWRFLERWAMQASSGVTWQFPDAEHVHGAQGFAGLAPERARQFDVGLEHRPAGRLRWRATVFARDEQNLLTLRDRYENAATGASRGVELLLERRAETGLSGWIAYSYGNTHISDWNRHPIRAPFDQRHAMTVAAGYGLSERTRLSAIFRAGSNFPGLPTYARLDLRAQRHVDIAGRRLTGFAEILNVFNHRNIGRTNGAPEPLLPRVALAGVRIDF